MAFDTSKIKIPDNIKGRYRANTQLGIDNATRDLNALPTKYGELRKLQTSKSKLGLTGLGNYAYGDDPSTPGVETNAVYRKDKQIGDREVGAVQDENAAANARGLQSSSFRDKAVGASLGRLSREAQAVMTEYATGIKGLDTEQDNDAGKLYDALNTLYVGESEYLQENDANALKAKQEADAETERQRVEKERADAAAKEPAATGPGTGIPTPSKDPLAARNGWRGPWGVKPTKPQPGYKFFRRKNDAGNLLWYSAPG